MTHLGLVSAAAAAAKGLDVVCFDVSDQRIGALEAGDLPVFEPGLSELITKVGARLTFTSDREELGRVQLVYLAEDVPTDDAGDSDLQRIDRLVETTVQHLARDAVMVVMSQVPPGYTRGRKWAHQRLFYQVETLVLGQAIERASRPERIIVGCARPDDLLPSAYQAFLDTFECPVLKMGYDSAELSKIAINCLLAASVTTANTIAELCEQLEADWQEMIPALQLDRRIGPNAYLSPGLGIGGGNLERDLRSVERLAEALGTEASVIRAIARNSAHRRDWALRTIRAQVLTRLHDPLIAVLGLAYKAGSASTKNSPSLALLRSLSNVRVRVFDPVVASIDEAMPNVEVAKDVFACCAGADAVAIMTPWEQFGAIAPDALANVASGRVVVDPFRVLDPGECLLAGLAHFTLGKRAALAEE